jgi:8-oxo-dGTP diphosphatase
MKHGRARPLAPLRLVPRQLYGLLREATRHVLRRPVVGACAIARDGAGRVLLVRRADSGDWALPGGTVDWGETVRQTVRRELAEEAGAELGAIERVTGIYSRLDRDPRFHAVTVCVLARLQRPALTGPQNRLEIREAALFDPAALPADIGHGMRDMLEHALGGGSDVLLE